MAQTSITGTFTNGSAAVICSPADDLSTVAIPAKLVLTGIDQTLPAAKTVLPVQSFVKVGSQPWQINLAAPFANASLVAVGAKIHTSFTARGLPIFDTNDTAHKALLNDLAATLENLLPTSVYDLSGPSISGHLPPSRLPLSGYASTDYNVLFVGDSLTYGYPNTLVTGAGTTTSGNSYPAIALAQLNVSGPNWSGVNLGVPGKFLSAMLADAPAQAAANYVPGKINIAVLLGGTNDYSATAPTDDPAVIGAAVAAKTASLCAAFRTYVGPDCGSYRVVIVTVPSTTYAYKDAARAAGNAVIRAHYTAYADALADLGADPALGAIGASDNTLWFQGDRIHPSLGGYARMGQLIAPYIYAARLGGLFRPQTVPNGVALPTLNGFVGAITDPATEYVSATTTTNYADIFLGKLTFKGSVYVVEVIAVEHDGYSNIRQRRFLVRLYPQGPSLAVTTPEDSVIGSAIPSNWAFAFSPDSQSLRMTYTISGDAAWVTYTVIDRLKS